MDELEQVAWLVQLQSEENILVQVLSEAVKHEVMLCLSYAHNLIKWMTRDSFHEPQWKYATQITSTIFGTRAKCRKTGRVLDLELRDDPLLLFQSASRVAKTTVMETKDSIKAIPLSNKVCFVALKKTKTMLFQTLEIWNWSHLLGNNDLFIFNKYLLINIKSKYITKCVGGCVGDVHLKFFTKNGFVLTCYFFTWFVTWFFFHVLIVKCTMLWGSVKVSLK